MCRTDSRYFVYRKSVCNANVTHCVFWASNGGTNVFRIQANAAQGVMLAGRNIMVDLPSGTKCGALDNVVCPLPVAIVGQLQTGYGIDDMKRALRRMGRSMLRMHAADWKCLREHERQRVGERKPIELIVASVPVSQSVLVARPSSRHVPVPVTVRPQSLTVTNTHPRDRYTVLVYGPRTRQIAASDLVGSLPADTVPDTMRGDCETKWYCVQRDTYGLLMP
jgi:hypothetical protein